MGEGMRGIRGIRGMMELALHTTDLTGRGGDFATQGRGI